MEHNAAARILKLRSITTALRNISGPFGWTMFWNNNSALECLNDDHVDHLWDHKWHLARKLESEDVQPIDLNSHQIDIFKLTIDVLLDVLALTYTYPDMNVRREATSRISYTLGLAIQTTQDVAFTAAALTFISDVTADKELMGAVSDSILEAETSKAYDPAPFIELIPAEYRSIVTTSLLAGLNVPAEASTMFFPVQEWIQWE